MTNKQTPPDWVLIEAAKRSAFHEVPFTTLKSAYSAKSAYRALCDMIQKYEQPPVDRKLLCAREAARQYLAMDAGVKVEWNGIRAIELWIEGYGK